MSATMIAPPATALLTTIETARAELKISPAQMPDADLTRKIEIASDRAAEFCGRAFGIATYRETFRQCRQLPSLVLDYAPIVSIAKAGIGGVALQLDQYEVDGSDFYSLSRSGVRVGWYGGPVVVEYRAGWVLPGEEEATYPATAPKLPKSIEQAVLQLMAASISAGGRGDPMLKVSEVEGVGRREYYVQGARAELAHPEAEATLKRYQRMVLA